jgi:hypothetical protein
LPFSRSSTEEQISQIICLEEELQANGPENMLNNVIIGYLTPPKFNNSTETNAYDSEVDKNPQNCKK